jgi:hypothetical protein
MNNKSALLAAIAPREEIIEVEGIKVKVRELESAAQSERLRDPGEATYAAMVLCCIDPDTNEPLFSEADIATLKTRSRRGMKVLMDAVIRVNGYDRDIEAGNSEAGPAAG